MTTIDHFTGDYNFLSNYHHSPIEVDGILYATVEHAFHAAKTLKLEEKRAIAAAATPGDAKRIGRLVKARADWEEVKVGIMENLVRLKFATHSDLRDMLLATGDARLIEGNWWKDTFWGVCRGKGQNQLGLILMKVRAELAPS